MVSPVWTAFSHLVKRSWWKRIWVIQEVTVGKEVLVLCGQKELPWDNLIANLLMFVQTLHLLGPEDAPIAPSEDAYFILKMANFRKKFKQNQNHRSLLEIMHLFRSCESTDARDKVFGILSLATKNSDLGFEADYSMPTNLVFTKFAEYIISTSRSLNILAHAWSLDKSAGLPSWVPDWSTNVKKPTLLRQSWNLDHSSRPYSSSKDRVPDVTFSSDLRVLSTQAFILGKTALVVEITRPGLMRHRRREFDSLVLNLLESVSWGAYRSEPVAKDAIRRTWILDKLGQVRIDNKNYFRFVDWYERDGPNPNPRQKKVPGKKVADGPDGTKIYMVEGRERAIFDYTVVPNFYAQAIRKSISSSNTEEDSEDEKFASQIYDSESGRAPFLTSSGLYCLGPNNMRQGDIVCVAIGAEVPWLIRVIEDSYYEFVGECYVHGFMDGSCMDVDLEKSNVSLEYINLR